MRGGLDLETGDVVERKVRRRRSEDGARIGLAPKRNWIARRDWECHVIHTLPCAHKGRHSSEERRLPEPTLGQCPSRPRVRSARFPG
jgi:hypothetical protein